MNIDEHIVQAKEWGSKLPYYPGMTGWRTTCRALAEEVERLRSELSFFANLNSYALPPEVLANKADEAINP